MRERENGSARGGVRGRPGRTGTLRCAHDGTARRVFVRYGNARGRRACEQEHEADPSARASVAYGRGIVFSSSYLYFIDKYKYTFEYVRIQIQIKSCNEYEYEYVLAELE